ncbi:MAG: tyrosine-protein phosphatase [Haliea sp.]|uniref:tyrosine-protein phosphatase n=1 Tax=Haliea sp. TaxID=1932666 RepID=UPI0032EE2644
MSRKAWLQGLFAASVLAVAVVQFIPSPPLVLPAELPPSARDAARMLDFEGIHNFRDLGGYTTSDGRSVQWGKLYRSGHLASASSHDLQQLQRLQLSTLIDFRSAAERAEEPSRLPDPLPFSVVNIPTLDEGNRAMVGELRQRVETGDFDGFDPDAFMLEANRQFATRFTTEYRDFMHQVLEADGRPVVWHCTAGKDRTGFAAAILLRVLGVPEDQIMADYLASREPALAARRSELLLLRLFKGAEAADTVGVMLGVEERWLATAFAAIDSHWESFDRYVSEGLQLSVEDIERLRQNLLVNAG